MHCVCLLREEMIKEEKTNAQLLDMSLYSFSFVRIVFLLFHFFSSAPSYSKAD